MDNVFEAPLAATDSRLGRVPQRWLNAWVFALQLVLGFRAVTLPGLVAGGFALTGGAYFQPHADVVLVGALISLVAAAFLYLPLLVIEFVLWSLWSGTLVAEVAEASRGAVGGTLEGFPHHPATAIGSWLVPLLNVFLPFLVLTDAWYRMETEPSTATGNRLPWTFDAWWGAYVAAGALGTGSMCVSYVPTFSVGVVGSTGLSIVAGAAEIAALILSLSVVLAFHRRHSAWRARIGLAP
jgi:hypothetical protein